MLLVLLRNVLSGGLVDIDSFSATIAGCARKHGRTAGIPTDSSLKAVISELERQRRICPDVEVRCSLTKRTWALRRSGGPTKDFASRNVLTS